MIQLGPKGLSGGLKRILNLLVEEISLVDRAATRRKFVLVKRDAGKKSFEVSEKELRRTNFMGFEETKNLQVGETMEFERSEELALPPDAVREIKAAIGTLSKVIGYKYTTKYKYAKPGDDTDKEKEDAENERINAKRKKKEEEPEEEDDDEEDDKKKKKMKKSTQTPKDKEIENAEVSKELETELKELSKLVDSDKVDKEKVQSKIDEILEKMSDAGGED